MKASNGKKKKRRRKRKRKSQDTQEQVLPTQKTAFSREHSLSEGSTKLTGHEKSIQSLLAENKLAQWQVVCLSWFNTVDIFGCVEKTGKIRLVETFYSNSDTSNATNSAAASATSSTSNSSVLHSTVETEDSLCHLMLKPAQSPNKVMKNARNCLTQLPGVEKRAKIGTKSHPCAKTKIQFLYRLRSSSVLVKYNLKELTEGTDTIHFRDLTPVYLSEICNMLLPQDNIALTTYYLKNEECYKAVTSHRQTILASACNTVLQQVASISKDRRLAAAIHQLADSKLNDKLNIFSPVMHLIKMYSDVQEQCKELVWTTYSEWKVQSQAMLQAKLLSIQQQEGTAVLRTNCKVVLDSIQSQYTKASDTVCYNAQIIHCILSLLPDESGEGTEETGLWH